MPSAQQGNGRTFLRERGGLGEGGSGSPSYRVRTHLFARGFRACRSRRPGDRSSEGSRYRPKPCSGRRRTSASPSWRRPPSSVRAPASWSLRGSPNSRDLAAQTPCPAIQTVYRARPEPVHRSRDVTFPRQNGASYPRNRPFGRDFRELPTP